jgi:glycosyltransferase involved in cell wall biosynthesis
VKVIHVTASLSRKAGGISAYIWKSASYQSLAGVTPVVAGLSDEYTDEDIYSYKEIATYAGKISWPAFWGYSPDLRRFLVTLVQKGNFDIIHNHGLWLYSNYLARRVAEGYNVPLVLSPHGMLEPYGLHRSSFKKNIARLVYENRNLSCAACIHATSDQEAQNIRDLGLKNPIAVIPIGLAIDEYSNTPASGAAVDDKWIELKNKKILLFMSRIHPKKGLINLIESWSKLSNLFPDWHLVIAGPDEGNHLRDVQAAVDAGNVSIRTTFTGPVYGKLKKDLLSVCDLFVLPTFSENFGIVITEALASAKPVITTKAAPWGTLIQDECGWWIDIGVEPLTSALKDAMSRTDAERSEMGRRGRLLVESQFSWPQITEQMLSVYEWVSNGGAPPECVMIT